MADCPTCEYHKQRAQLWRDEVYRLVGHPLPRKEKSMIEDDDDIQEYKKPWVGLHTTQIQDIYQEILKEWRGGSMPDGQIAFAKAIEQALKERNT